MPDPDPILTDETFNRAAEAAYLLLRTQDRARADLAARLQKQGFEPSIIEKVLCYLEARGLIGDEKLARHYIEARSEVRPQSKHRMRDELVRKGLDEATIDATLRDWDEQRETLSALTALQVRWGETAPRADVREVRRWISYLARRGFEEEIVEIAVRAYVGDVYDSIVDGA